MKKSYLAISAALMMGAGAVAQACTLDSWVDGAMAATANGGVTSGGPKDMAPISRYSGKCGMQLATTGHVQDSSPGAEGRIITRFYFYPATAAGGTATNIFVAYSSDGITTDALTNAFSVAYDGTNVTLALAGGNSSAAVPVSANRWHSIEVDWQSGVDTSWWVDVDATTDPATEVVTGSGTATTIEAVRLGTPDGLNVNTISFDDYESRRTTAIGRLIAGDANNDGNVNSGDIIGVINEFFGTEMNLALGQPDCNEDGNVNSGDIICVINTFFAP